MLLLPLRVWRCSLVHIRGSGIKQRRWWRRRRWLVLHPRCQGLDSLQDHRVLLCCHLAHHASQGLDLASQGVDLARKMPRSLLLLLGRQRILQSTALGLGQRTVMGLEILHGVGPPARLIQAIHHGNELLNLVWWPVYVVHEKGPRSCEENPLAQTRFTAPHSGGPAVQRGLRAKALEHGLQDLRLEYFWAIEAIPPRKDKNAAIQGTSTVQ
mmetsp:Transcript_17268/g.50339  ORF Transcript_17268/g.50339 Transcript_17268/m.50339 type:complete len:212 (-) Transcript_17268:432-1067(-)